MNGKIYLSTGIIWRKGKEQGSVLYRIRPSKIVPLDSVSTKMVERCAEGYSVEEAAAQTAQEMNIKKESIQDEFLHLCETLRADGFLTSDKDEGKLIVTEEIFPPLDNVVLRLTYRCNLRCRHCFLGAGDYQPDVELTTEEVKTFIDQLSRVKVFGLTLTGGEPMVRDDFFDILKYTEKKDVPLYLFTNGTLVDEEAMEIFAHARNLAYVLISLDGATPEIHDYIRGRGNFGMTVSFVKSITNLGIPVCFDTCINKINFHQYKEFVPLSRKLNGSAFHAEQISLEGRAEAHENELGLTMDQKNEIRAYFNEEARRAEDIVIGEVLPHELTKKLLYKDEEKKDKCGVGWGFCQIWPNGDVYPCRAMHHLKMKAGNIRKESFIDIWQNAEIFKTLRSLSVETISECSICRVKYLCGGGCRARAYRYYRDWYKPDPESCKFRKAMAEELSQKYKKIYAI